MIKLCTLTFLSFLPLASAALCGDIANCGTSDGYSYFASAGISANAPQASKWVTNGIKSGAMTLTQNADGSLDLMVKDTMSISSVRANGAKLFVLGRSPEFISVLVVWPQLSESYTFLKTSTGAEVLWTQNKFNNLMPMVSAFRADCDYLSLSN